MNELILVIGIIGLVAYAAVSLTLYFQPKAPAAPVKNGPATYTRRIRVMLPDASLRTFRNIHTFCKHFGCRENQAYSWLAGINKGYEKFGIAAIEYADGQGVTKTKPVSVQWRSKQGAGEFTGLRALADHLNVPVAALRNRINGIQPIPANAPYSKIWYTGSPNRSRPSRRGKKTGTPAMPRTPNKKVTLVWKRDGAREYVDLTAAAATLGMPTGSLRNLINGYRGITIDQPFTRVYYTGYPDRSKQSGKVRRNRKAVLQIA